LKQVPLELLTHRLGGDAYGGIASMAAVLVLRSQSQPRLWWKHGSRSNVNKALVLSHVRVPLTHLEIVESVKSHVATHKIYRLDSIRFTTKIELCMPC
jgi:hypothetical protein